MKLSEFNAQRQATTERNRQGWQGDEQAQIQDFVPYQRGGIRCRLATGEEVVVTGSGNVPGMSPVKEHITAAGKFEVAQLDDYTVIDRDYLPHSTQQLQQVEREIGRHAQRTQN